MPAAAYLAAYLAGCLSACLSACSAAERARYDPEPVPHPVPLPADAFDRVLGAVRDRYRRIDVAERDAFRIQTPWLPFQPGDIPGFRRVSVFRDGADHLGVVVEMYFLELSTGGATETDVVGDRREEQRFAQVLRRELAR